MNQITLEDRIITLEDEFRGSTITYANQCLLLNKLNCLKEEILNEYQSRLCLDNSLKFLDNIKYMNNGMRDEVITLCEKLIYVDRFINKVERIFNEQNENM